MWAFGYWYANSGILFSAVFADYQRRADFSSLPVTWVAVEDGKPVGIVSLKEYDLLSHKHLTPWLSALYVIPEYRKRGIARKLIETVIDYASSLGYSSVHLFTDNRKNDYLERYYSSLGWSTIEKTLDHRGEPTRVMRYVLPLKADSDKDTACVIGIDAHSGDSI
jgi:GNAT superfamily N-acetyltransferase